MKTIAHRQAITMSFRDQVEYLLTTVGPRITASGAGLNDARQLAAWRKGAEPRSAIKEDRVQIMIEATIEIRGGFQNDAGSAAIAAAFLRSSQPSLCDAAPVMLIRAATDETVISVAEDIRGAVRGFLA